MRPMNPVPRPPLLTHSVNHSAPSGPVVTQWTSPPVTGNDVICEADVALTGIRSNPAPLPVPTGLRLPTQIAPSGPFVSPHACARMPFTNGTANVVTVPVVVILLMVPEEHDVNQRLLSLPVIMNVGITLLGTVNCARFVPLV